MFERKKCDSCGEKLSGKFDFCPYCGEDVRTKSNKDEWGMLGKNDFMQNSNMFESAMLGGFSGKMLNKMLSNAMKMLEKEMHKSEAAIPKTNFELFINGRRISPESIKMTRKEAKPQKQPINSFSENNLKKFAELPKLEPSTNIRRLANKVVYEIDVPGVEKTEDILINQLENSLEIKAIAKDKAYKKLIPIDLPLTKYKLLNEKLILELSIK
ncbi:MAG: hypothetical protein AABW50_02490 [Nanoarchaeota archaeon]